MPVARGGEPLVFQVATHSANQLFSQKDIASQCDALESLVPPLSRHIPTKPTTRLATSDPDLGLPPATALGSGRRICPNHVAARPIGTA